MKYIAKDKYAVVDVVATKNENLFRLVLGVLDYSGKNSYFVDKEKIEGIEKGNIVDVELELNTATRRIHDRKADEAEFLEVITNVNIKSIKRVES